jgi:hypothetical protein
MSGVGGHEAARAAILGYARALDRLDGALLRAAFWDDATIDMGAIYRGPPAGFVDVALGFMGMFAATRHEVSNILLVEAGQGALGFEAYVRAWHRLADRPAELVVLGRYVGRVEARGGAWRIAAHAEILDWGEERGVDAGWWAAEAALPHGRRDRDDPSYAWLAAAASAR